jgi:hypothetical protein
VPKEAHEDGAYQPFGSSLCEEFKGAVEEGNLLEGGSMTLTRYLIEVGCRVESKAEDLEPHFLRLMDALLEEPGAIDPDITAELATGDILISMGVDAKTDRSALELALVYARSAIHKVGGATPDWGQSKKDAFYVTEGFDARVRPADVSAC